MAEVLSFDVRLDDRTIEGLAAKESPDREINQT